MLSIVFHPALNTAIGRSLWKRRLQPPHRSSITEESEGSKELHTYVEGVWKKTLTRLIKHIPADVSWGGLQENSLSEIHTERICTESCCYHKESSKPQQRPCYEPQHLVFFMGGEQRSGVDFTALSRPSFSNANSGRQKNGKQLSSSPGVVKKSIKPWLKWNEQHLLLRFNYGWS